jgi:hypothetical protein
MQLPLTRIHPYLQIVVRIETHHRNVLVRLAAVRPNDFGVQKTCKTPEQPSNLHHPFFKQRFFARDNLVPDKNGQRMLVVDWWSVVSESNLA